MTPQDPLRDRQFLTEENLGLERELDVRTRTGPTCGAPSPMTTAQSVRSNPSADPATTAKNTTDSSWSI